MRWRKEIRHGYAVERQIPGLQKPTSSCGLDHKIFILGAICGTRLVMKRHTRGAWSSVFWNGICYRCIWTCSKSNYIVQKTVLGLFLLRWNREMGTARKFGLKYSERGRRNDKYRQMRKKNEIYWARFPFPPTNFNGSSLSRVNPCEKQEPNSEQSATTFGKVAT